MIRLSVHFLVLWWRSTLISKGSKWTVLSGQLCFAKNSYLIGEIRGGSVTFPCCNAMTMRCRTRHGRTEEWTNRRTIRSSYFRQALNSLCETRAYVLMIYNTRTFSNQWMQHQKQQLILQHWLSSIGAIFFKFLGPPPPPPKPRGGGATYKKKYFGWRK